jgi:hypothetical protein
MRIVVVFAAMAWILGTAVSARAQADSREAPVDSLALARQYSIWLYTGEVDSLLAHSSDETRANEAQDPTFRRVSGLIAERAGFEVEVVEETWKLRNGACQYWRTATFSNMDEPILLRWVMDPQGRITGLGAGPLSQAPPVQAETCAPQEG